MTTRTSLIRLITVALFSAVLAGTWDVWWHAALGRETFWSPPHLLLYASVIVAICTGFYGWFITRKRSWAWLSIILFLVPASAPFDELWHHIFGSEPVNGVLIVWSPPHVALVLSLVASFLFLFAHLRRDEDAVARHVLQSAALAAVLSLLLFLLSPFEPTGPHHLLGFVGAGISSALVVLVFLLAQEWMKSFGSAMTVAAVFMLLSAMNFDHEPSPLLNIQPHDHAPGWLMIFSCTVPAALIDLFHKQSLIVRGLIVGALHGGILYGFSSQFFEPQFQYSSIEMWVAIGTSLAAGLAIGSLLSFVRPPPSSHSS